MHNKVYHLVQEVLNGHRSIHEGISLLQRYRRKMDEIEYSRSFCAIRLFKHLDHVEKELDQTSSIYDVASLLRQFIEMYRTRVTVSSELARKLNPAIDSCGLHIDSVNEVDILDEWPDWLPKREKLDPIFQLEQRRKQEQQMGDSLLYGMTGYVSYTSREQKLMIQASMNMKPGDTLLACLPTGGGKSLVGLLPSFFETKGGTLRGAIDKAGTTIVVVPTVSLALDQCRAAKDFFSRVSDTCFMPQAYVGDMKKEERSNLFQSLSEGTIPVLFTSPEALMNRGLNDVVMQAARKGFINRLVIDEAHIVVDWGIKFRTEFQLLSAWRKRLLEESKGRLKTVLLSATVTDWTAKILRELFSEPGHYTEVRSDQLRPEPTYLLDTSISEEIRYNKIVNSIHLLPKPIILYVSKKEHAKKWRDLIREKGYRSVEIFTGDVSGGERQRIVEWWNEDKIDIMIATSAFGMGVDKRDIRTIIHCCMPESINRFYQEVGRAGRDGLASLSLLSFVPQDEEVARGLMSNAVITTETLTERWDRLFSRSTKTDLSDEYWIRMSVQPSHLEGTQSGKQNQDWNESLLLLLYRHKFIDVKQVIHDENGNREILVKVLYYETINDPKLLYEAVEPYRKQERDRINKELAQMKKLIDQGNDHCFSTFFSNMYPYVERICSGCPYCWRTGSETLYMKQKTSIPYRSAISSTRTEIVGPLSNYVWGSNEVLLIGDHTQRSKPEMIAELMRQLLKANVSVFLLPPLDSDAKKRIIEQLPWEEIKLAHTILPYDEIDSWFIENEKDPIEFFLEGHMAIFYSENEAVNNHFYRWLKEYQHRTGAVVIHIAETNLWIRDEGRTLDNLVNAIPFEVDDYMKKQADSLDLKLI
ncbi:MAG TPA: protein DpdF [Bacillus sp. (in: firmicutes)]|nr:protein DpdF [Bacillus sp. (in: firmicutes)]